MRFQERRGLCVEFNEHIVSNPSCCLLPAAGSCCPNLKINLIHWNSGILFREDFIDLTFPTKDLWQTLQINMESVDNPARYDNRTSWTEIFVSSCFPAVSKSCIHKHVMEFRLQIIWVIFLAYMFFPSSYMMPLYIGW